MFDRRRQCGGDSAHAAIRRRLARIVTPANADAWSDATRFRAELLPLLPAEIEVVELPPPEDQQYNCFTFALGLHEMPGNRGRYDEASITDGFLLKLAELGELESRLRPSVGDLLVYWNGNVLTHAGVVAEPGWIVSKWSAGPLLKHRPRHVPAFYGDDLRYFRRPSRQRIQALHRKHRAADVWVTQR